MKPLFFFLLMFPIAASTQQPTAISPKTTLTVAATDFSGSINNIAAITTKIKAISVTIRASLEQISALNSLRDDLKNQLAELQKQKPNLGSDPKAYETALAQWQEKVNAVQKKIEEVEKKISDLRKSTDAQLAEVDKLQDSIDEQRKKMEGIAARERQNKEQSKQTDVESRTVVANEEKALAYSHVKIIIDSIPSITSRLSVTEKNLVNEYNSRFNNDEQFRTTTMVYIKLAKSSNYFTTIDKAGSAIDRTNRFLVAAKEELAILNK